MYEIKTMDLAFRVLVQRRRLGMVCKGQMSALSTAEPYSKVARITEDTLEAFAG